MLFFSYVLRIKYKIYHREVQESDDRIRSFIQEHLASLLVVHTYTREDSSCRQAEDIMDIRIKARIRRSHFSNLCNTAVSFSMIGAQTIGIGLCSWGILNGVITYGTMSAAIYLVNLLEGPLVNLAGSVTTCYSMIASAERLMEIEESPLDSKGKPKSPKELTDYYEHDFSSIEIDNIWFSYEEDEKSAVLRGLTFQVKKGEYVAFTGESGCGKSTMLKILLGLYPLMGGSVSLKDKSGNVHSMNSAWRGLFAYVPQGNQLISGTIRETLTFGDPHLMKQEDKIWRALKIACADGFVKELHEGLDYVLGERGSGLSEGQMQRLSIARAIMSERPILLLDECTSALDENTERQLLQNLQAMTDHTVFTITHRQAVLKYCDKKIRFDK